MSGTYLQHRSLDVEDVMKTSGLVAVVVAAVVVGACSAPSVADQGGTSTVVVGHEGTLTNADVIKLTKSGLGDEVIVAKIGQAQTDFRLDTDSLVQLKNEGVGDTIIAAMLKAGSSSTNRTGTRVTSTPTGAL